MHSSVVMPLSEQYYYFYPSLIMQDGKYIVLLQVVTLVFWGFNLTSLLQKLQERQAVLAKMVFTDEKQRERWLYTMRIDMMSSEESGHEGDSEVMIVKTIPWRSDQVNRLLKKIIKQVQNAHPKPAVK